MSNKKAIWLRVGLAFLAFILIGAGDGAFGVVLPSLQSTYNVNKATVSILFLFGTAGFLTSAFTSGLLVEKLGRRLYLTLGPCIYMLGAAGMAAQLGFVPSMASVMVLAFGAGIIDAGLNAYVAGFPNNTGLLNYLHAFYGIGAFTGPALASSVIVSGLSWAVVYMVWIAIGLPVALGLWLALRGEGRAAHKEQVEQDGAIRGNVLMAALKLRIVWLGAVFLLLYVGGEVSLGTWSYSLLTQERGQPALVAGWTISGFWMGLTLSRLVLGALAKKIGDRALVQACLVGVLAGLLLVWLPPKELTGLSTVTGIVGLWVTGFCLGPIFPTMIAVISRMAPPRLLATSVGFMSSAGSAGAAFFPWLGGNLAQNWGLWVLMPYVIVLSMLMQVCWWFLQNGKRTEEADRAAEVAEVQS